MNVRKFFDVWVALVLTLDLTQVWYGEGPVVQTYGSVSWFADMQSHVPLLHSNCIGILVWVKKSLLYEYFEA